jgi:hypothetical protein
MAHLPKKYERHLTALLQAYPHIVDTHTIEIPTMLLGILWHCATSDLIGVLTRMTARKSSPLTYSLRDNPDGMGQIVQLCFHGEVVGGGQRG